MQNTIIYMLIALLFITTSGKIQAQDDLKKLNAEQVIQLVKQYHPVVRKTSIEIEKSKADITIARASFDPIIGSSSSEKVLDGTKYYHYFSPEIKIPTWYGIDIVGGLDNLSGSKVDPTETFGKSSFVGLNIPLAKNLLMDKRRAFLKQAKIFNTMAEVEQRSIINDLLMDALQSYWEWVRAYQTYVVIKNNVETNQKRVDFVKKSFINGERAAIDTVEAITQLQSFRYQQNQYWLEFQNAGLALSAYLWKENNDPYILPETIIPQEGWENEVLISNFILSLPDLLISAQNFHPDLQLYGYKLNVLGIDKKLKFQEFLPKVDFKYNFLNKSYNAFENVGSPFLQNNYVYGLEIEVPLFFSQARGEYRKANLKIEETKIDQAQKQLAIDLKVRSYFNEYLTLKNQIALQSQNFENYQQLARAEEIKFFNGESSLFLINSRENKSLEALEKLVELKTKYYNSIYTLQWSAGLLQ